MIPDSTLTLRIQFDKIKSTETINDAIKLLQQQKRRLIKHKLKNQLPNMGGSVSVSTSNSK